MWVGLVQHHCHMIMAHVIGLLRVYFFVIGDQPDGVCTLHASSASEKGAMSICGRSGVWQAVTNSHLIFQRIYLFMLLAFMRELCSLLYKLLKVGAISAYGYWYIASVMSNCCLATMSRKMSDNRETYWCFILFPLLANIMPSTIDIGVVINGYHHLSGGRVGIHSTKQGGMSSSIPSPNSAF